MKDSLATMIKRLVTPVDERRILDIDYKMYDVTQPHCGEATAYRNIFGGMQYRCTHEVTP